MSRAMFGALAQPVCHTVMKTLAAFRTGLRPYISFKGGNDRGFSLRGIKLCKVTKYVLSN